MGSMAIHQLALVAAFLHTVACPPETVFAPVGKSITLVMNPQCDVADADYAVWVFNHKDIVTYYPHHPENHKLRVLSSYKSKVKFDARDLSMELKNLTKNDCGVFKGMIKTPEDKTVVEYKLSVLEPAVKPILTTHPNWSSGDECNGTVTCKAGDLSVTSSCNISTCTQDGDSTHGGLSIFTRHGSIICNHSNPVNWSQDAVDIRELCPPKPKVESLIGDDPQNSLVLDQISFGSIGVIMIGVVIVIGVLWRAKRPNKQEPSGAPENRTPGVRSPKAGLLSGNGPSGSVSPKTPSSERQREGLLSSGSVRQRTNLHSPNSFGVEIPLTPSSEGQTPMQRETLSSGLKINLLNSFEEADGHAGP